MIGSTGTDASFDPPFLRNSLVVWHGGSIQDVESNQKKELSSAYRYRADMTPGEVEGQDYDGVMRDIVGNHVALVKEGRAGSDVVVGDSKPEELSMSKVLSRKGAVAQGALHVFLKPLLAADAKMPDLSTLLKGVDAKNFKAKKASIANGLKALTQGKLAKDATIEEVVNILDNLDDANPVETIEGAIEEKKDEVKDDVVDAVDADNDEVRAFLASKGLTDEDIAKVCSMIGGEPATDNEPKLQPAKDKEPDVKDKKDEKKPDFVTKTAMDAALERTRKEATQIAMDTARGIRDAERAVTPWVGTMSNVIAQDGTDVYKAALETLGVKVPDGIDKKAYQAILEAQPLPNARPVQRTAAVAMDEAAQKSYAERFGVPDRFVNIG